MFTLALPLAPVNAFRARQQDDVKQKHWQSVIPGERAAPQQTRHVTRAEGKRARRQPSGAFILMVPFGGALALALAVFHNLLPLWCVLLLALLAFVTITMTLRLAREVTTLQTRLEDDLDQPAAAPMQPTSAGPGLLTDLPRILAITSVIAGMNVLVFHHAVLPTVLLGGGIACVITMHQRHQRVRRNPLLHSVPPVQESRTPLSTPWRPYPRSRSCAPTSTRSGERLTADLALIRELGTRGQRQAEVQRLEEHRRYLEDLSGGGQNRLTV